ncbi:peptidoglycan-binding domain-containing protein [Allocoleopsis sp.]|uniref:peptidoglycan-binding domain-containing protein n=1 Tax=Allocoleopsis sp. TaxID=3088169 RepID=UPI002FD00E25
MAKNLTLGVPNAEGVRRWMIYSSTLSLLMIGLENVPAEASGDLSTAQTIAQLIADTSINRPILKLGSEGSAVSELQAALKLLGYYKDVVDGVYQESTAIAVSQFQQAAGLTPDGITGPATWNRLFPTTTSVVRTSPTLSNNPAPVRTLPPSSNNPAPVRSAPTSSNNPASSFPVPTIVQSTNTSDRVNRPAPEKPAVARSGNLPNSNRPASIPANSSTSTSSQAAVVTLPVLKQGMQGPAVVQLQERLKTLGFLKATVDGVFGEATQTAVKAAQQKFNIAPDGVVGPTTWSALLR